MLNGWIVWLFDDTNVGAATASLKFQKLLVFIPCLALLFGCLFLENFHKYLKINFLKSFHIPAFFINYPSGFYKKFEKTALFLLFLWKGRALPLFHLLLPQGFILMVMGILSS